MARVVKGLYKDTTIDAFAFTLDTNLMRRIDAGLKSTGHPLQAEDVGPISMLTTYTNSRGERCHYIRKDELGDKLLTVYKEMRKKEETLLHYFCTDNLQEQVEEEATRAGFTLQTYSAKVLLHE